MKGIKVKPPVVRITDGITAMVNGNYNVDFPEDSFYKDVYNSLNHMASVFQSRPWAGHSREIIETRGGDIHLESVPRQGTMVEIRFDKPSV